MRDQSYQSPIGYRAKQLRNMARRLRDEAARELAMPQEQRAVSLAELATEAAGLLVEASRWYLNAAPGRLQAEAETGGYTDDIHSDPAYVTPSQGVEP